MRSNKEDVHKILQLEERKSSREKFVTKLGVNGKEVVFEVDNGAAVTLMSEHQTRRLFPEAEMQSTNLRLITFCDTEVKIVGYITVSIRYENINFKLNLYITKIDRKPLLGREWMSR